MKRPGGHKYKFAHLSFCFCFFYSDRIGGHDSSTQQTDNHIQCKFLAFVILLTIQTVYKCFLKMYLADCLKSWKIEMDRYYFTKSLQSFHPIPVHNNNWRIFVWWHAHNLSF